MDVSGSAEDAMADSCEHSTETIGFIRGRDILD